MTNATPVQQRLLDGHDFLTRVRRRLEADSDNWAAIRLINGCIFTLMQDLTQTLGHGYRGRDRIL